MNVLSLQPPCRKILKSFRQRDRTIVTQTGHSRPIDFVTRRIEWEISGNHGRRLRDFFLVLRDTTRAVEAVALRAARFCLAGRLLTSAGWALSGDSGVPVAICSFASGLGVSTAVWAFTGSLGSAVAACSFTGGMSAAVPTCSFTGGLGVPAAS